MFYTRECEKKKWNHKLGKMKKRTGELLSPKNLNLVDFVAYLVIQQQIAH